ncbi:Two pore domain potassium channel domain-containing protein [Strongyloides ratti]|uniref:Two pore domain potassium channel domain-containing protein n=1 Tax=Strongyloides ratti TaxID=34506 RepID=A0A090LJ50_STRRB|nr:Two pore domain potassium channel domain-containing protein [Strongyloides ratti]CEF69847.1 Two pore domain potassium channel domain-containing protein [Strongyloides ratti]
MENIEKKTQIRLYIYIIIIFLYFGYGVIFFYYLEHSASIQRQEEYNERCKFISIKSLSDINKDLDSMMKEDIEQVSSNFTINSIFYKKILKNIDEIDQCHLFNSGVNVKEVDIFNAISFIYGITITLGSGDVYAITNEGKIFFIVFSISLIPFVIAFYTDFIEGVLSSMVYKLNFIILYVKNKFSKRKMNESIYQNELFKMNKKPLQYYVLFLISLISIFVICTGNHYYQSYLSQTNDTVIQSLTYIIENFALIGLGYNVPKSTVKYLTRELPLMLIGIFLFSLYINMAINFIRHLIPKKLNNYRNKNLQNNDKFDFIKYLIYKHEEEIIQIPPKETIHFY